MLVSLLYKVFSITLVWGRGLEIFCSKFSWHTSRVSCFQMGPFYAEKKDFPSDILTRQIPWKISRWKDVQNKKEKSRKYISLFKTSYNIPFEYNMKFQTVFILSEYEHASLSYT